MPPDDPRNPTDEPPTTDRSDSIPFVDGASSGAESLVHILRQMPRPAPGPVGPPRVPGYEIECELGRGGMGVVYKARDTELNRTVALKMILTSETPSAGEVARFRAEAEAVAAVRHENVVRVYGLCPPDCTHPYFTMEYVAGGSLAKHLKARGRLAPADAAALIAAVADGVQAAHDADIVHRDIKPANILLEQIESPAPSFRPKVSDFGLAKRLAFDLTRTQGMRGTPAYMSPEQAGGGAYVGPGSDVYALGAVLFECLTGRPPFDSEDQFAIIQDVIHTPAPSPRGLNPAVPADLELICSKCLEKNPQHRYLTVAALAADLRNFGAGRPVSVRPIGPVRRAARWARRRPTAAALVAVLLLALFVLPPVAVWAAGRVTASADRADKARALADAAQAREAEAQARALAADKDRRAAQKAEEDAVKLANAQKLFALQTVLRNRAANRPLAWTHDNRADLLHAFPLAAGDPGALGELRSAGAVALLAADLKPLDPVQKGFTASAVATDPKSGLVALGEYLTWPPLSARVRLIDPATGATARELTFTAGLVRNPDGTVRSAPDSVRALAFSPDGASLFVGTRSSQVIRFDLRGTSNKEAARWRASTGPVEQLAVGPDGTSVYGVYGSEKPVFVWDAEAGKPLAKLAPSAEAPITGFAVLAGGLVTCDAHELRRWGADHKPVQAVANDGVWKLTRGPSGALLAAAGRNLDVYDPVGLTPVDRFGTAELRRGAHEQNVRTIAVHPSGAFVASASGDEDRTLRVWELASCRLVGTVTVKGTGPIAVAWSADGAVLLATGHGHVGRWAFRPGAQAFACLSALPLAAAALGPGDRVAAVTDPIGDRRELLAGAAGAPARAVRFDPGVNARPGLAYAPDGRLAVVGPPGVVRWEPGAPEPEPVLGTDDPRVPRFGPGGDAPLWAVIGSSEVHSFDARYRVRTTWSNWMEGKTFGVASLDALAVGRGVVAAGARSGSVHVLDAGSGQPQFVASVGRDPVVSVAVAPDDALIAAGTQSGKVRLIRTSDRAELPPLAAHPDAVNAVALNAAGTLLATGGGNRTVRLWKRAGERFEPLFTVPDLSGPVRELQFHPSEDRLLVLVTGERVARVWDIERLKGQLGRYKLAW